VLDEVPRARGPGHGGQGWRRPTGRIGTFPKPYLHAGPFTSLYTGAGQNSCLCPCLPLTPLALVDRGQRQTRASVVKGWERWWAVGRRRVVHDGSVTKECSDGAQVREGAGGRKRSGHPKDGGAGTNAGGTGVKLVTERGRSARAPPSAKAARCRRHTRVAASRSSMSFAGSRRLARRRLSGRTDDSWTF
jgi:hypothetical protein